MFGPMKTFTSDMGTEYKNFIVNGLTIYTRDS